MKKAYQLNVCAIGIQAEDGKDFALVIPAGAILNHLREEKGFAICAWEGHEIRLLSFDLWQRGALVRLSAN